MNRFRPRTPPLTRTMDSGFRERVLSTLFPAEEGDGPPFPLLDTEETWEEEMEVTAYEVERAAKKIGERKAPGPDGSQAKSSKLLAP